MTDPIAWVYEIARAINAKTGEYTDWERRVSFTKPNCPGLRNVEPLFKKVPDAEVQFY